MIYLKDNMDITTKQTLILNELNRIDDLIKTYELIEYTKKTQNYAIVNELSRLNELHKVLYDNLDDKHLKIHLGINDSENVVLFK